MAESIVKALEGYFRARCTLIHVVTAEEARAEADVMRAAFACGMDAATWDCFDGVKSAAGQVRNAGVLDPADALAWIRSRAERTVFILRDVDGWLQSNVVRRALRSVARELLGQPRDAARSIVMLCAKPGLPEDLRGQAMVVDYPLPEREEILAALDEALEALPEESRGVALEGLRNGEREQAIDAAVGLAMTQAENSFALSLVSTGTVDPLRVAAEKRQVISEGGVLTWFDADPRGFSAVGGLEEIKEWTRVRKLAFSPAAREYGLPVPKGLFLTGVAGCGKSMIAKAIGSEWRFPILRLDFGAAMSKWVGESEGNARRAQEIAERCAPCILWIDEIEKGLAGTTGPQGDGGAGARMLGSFLTWMQEKVAPVFVIATCNDITGLPPELLRRGRFDELFFVDLPNGEERAAIAGATLRGLRRDPAAVGDLAAFVAMSEGWSGAEIAATCGDALNAAFFDGARELRAADLVEAGRSVVPLSATSKEKLDALRAWSVGRARPATRRAPEGGARAARALEL